MRREPTRRLPDLLLASGPQMVEISRDGRRVYLTNSLYAARDDAVYADGVGAWMAKLDADVPPGVSSPTADSSYTATTSVGFAPTKPGSKAVTRPVPLIATPAERLPVEVDTARSNISAGTAKSFCMR